MYRLNVEKMFFDIADGQAVVINLLSGIYYGTTALGSVVLESRKRVLMRESAKPLNMPNSLRVISAEPVCMPAVS